MKRDFAGATRSTLHTHALTRGLSMLELLARGTVPRTLGEIHQETGLPKSTLVRLLATLTELEFVVRVDERPAYRLGYKVMELARAHVRGLDLSEVAGGQLAGLAERTQQTSNLGVLDGEVVLHVCVAQPDRPLRFRTVAGARAHTHCTGLGKMLLAALPEAEVDDHLPAGPLTRSTARTLTSRDTLRRELAATAERGYALDDNENSEGLRCLAVPVAAGGTVLAAVSVAGPAAEFEPAHHAGLLAQLRATATELAGDPAVVAALRELVGERS
ncbi:IclR family transcriptional regulator [Actinophytocola sp.]|uniref:IclR family transcriptional regulator n=1 Tax=Actinophytocola sp. TaxID=1872138 RepID=UPI002EDB08D8